MASLHASFSGPKTPTKVLSNTKLNPNPPSHKVLPPGPCSMHHTHFPPQINRNFNWKSKRSAQVWAHQLTKCFIQRSLYFYFGSSATILLSPQSGHRYGVLLGLQTLDAARSLPGHKSLCKPVCACFGVVSSAFVSRQILLLLFA